MTATDPRSFLYRDTLDPDAALRLVRTIGRAADQHEAAITVSAIDIAGLVDLQPHARMAERSAAGNVGGTVASDAGLGDAGGFGRRQHSPAR